MTIKIEAGQTHTVTGYPFVRYVADLYDEDDVRPYQRRRAGALAVPSKPMKTPSPTFL